jgi:Glycosyl transferases group 1
VFIVPNTVNEEMIRLADAALASRERGTKDVTIAYFSGTATHDRDFAQAADAVLAALEASPAVQFIVVGNLRMDERFGKFRDRITELPIQPWQRLPALMADVDISLAPLEPDNAFTESKSCLKYLEAALLGVPTVASPRHDFRRVISDGVNGVLAETPDEWREAISRLAASSDLRSSIGKAAFEDVRANHTTWANAQRLYDLLADLAAQKRSSLRPFAINFVSSGAGNGARSNRKLADDLALRGHRVEFTSGSNDLPHADVLIALGADAAEDAAVTDTALFRMCVVNSTDERERVSRLPLRVVEGPFSAERLERLLRRVCFTRIADLTVTANAP